MPLNPKSLQGLRNLFKPAEAAISTAPEIKGALTTIAESPQAPSMLEAVMNKDMSRREFMKRGAATTANQLIPNAVKSLAVKQLAKEALQPVVESGIPGGLKDVSARKIAALINRMDGDLTYGNTQELSDLVSDALYVVDSHYGDVSDILKLGPGGSNLQYDPTKLPELKEAVKDILKQGERGDIDLDDNDYSDLWKLGSVIKALPKSESANFKKLQWEQLFGKPVKGTPQYETYSWFKDPKTDPSEIDQWFNAMHEGYTKKYHELNPGISKDPRVKVFPAEHSMEEGVYLGYPNLRASVQDMEKRPNFPFGKVIGPGQWRMTDEEIAWRKANDAFREGAKLDYPEHNFKFSDYVNDYLSGLKLEP